jgi:hypothetical protein
MNTRNLQKLMNYKLKNTNKPTKHESLFNDAIQAVKQEMIDEGIYIGRIVPQKIFMTSDYDHAYLTDIFLPSLRLVFEIDGYSHNNQRQYDARRTAFLNKRRCQVIRFKNIETEDHHKIKDKIKSSIRSRFQQLGNKSNVQINTSAEIDNTMTPEMREFINNGGKVKICPAKTRKNRL